MCKATSIFISLLLLIVSCDARSINKNEGKPRIFFDRVIAASGIFPLEVNVPNTIAAMYGGMMSSYAFMQGYFAGNGDTNEGQTAASEAIKQPEAQQLSTTSAESGDKSPLKDPQNVTGTSSSATAAKKPAELNTMRKNSRKTKKKKVKFTTADYLRMANLILM